MTVPSYGNRPPVLPPYDVRHDPMWRPDREYGPGHPFCSPAHEAYEAMRIEQEKVRLWIERKATEALKLRDIINGR